MVKDAGLLSPEESNSVTDLPPPSITIIFLGIGDLKGDPQKTRDPWDPRESLAVPQKKFFCFWSWTTDKGQKKISDVQQEGN